MTTPARYIATGIAALIAYVGLILGLFWVASAPPEHFGVLAKADRLDVCSDVCVLSGAAP